MEDRGPRDNTPACNERVGSRLFPLSVLSWVSGLGNLSLNLVSSQQSQQHDTGQHLFTYSPNGRLEEV